LLKQKEYVDSHIYKKVTNFILLSQNKEDLISYILSEGKNSKKTKTFMNFLDCYVYFLFELEDKIDKDFYSYDNLLKYTIKSDIIDRNISCLSPNMSKDFLSWETDLYNRG
jgi:hypothetical protein